MWQDCPVADGGMRWNAAIELNHHHRRRLWLSLGVTGVAAPQLLEVIGGRLPSTPPTSSIITLIRKYPSAHVVPAGPMGGSAACFEQTAGTADSTAMCAWSDSDSFGILTSPTLSVASLADLMVQDRPLIELVKK